MANHLTVRMAWHDNNWNGKVCNDPTANVYCTGNHSLLSERLEREKDIKIESANANVQLDKIPNYLPPCFWTSNAFSSLNLQILHRHPYRGNFKADPITDDLPAYSVFTWPFRLSFNHGRKKQEEQGQFPPDLVQRVQRFEDKFVPGKSIAFFYLNYDNPVSADDEAYALVGCALISKILYPKEFNIDPSSEARLKRNPKYKNLPHINWAIPVLYDFQNLGVLLPYKEYLEKIEQIPGDRVKLDEMKVLIEEEELLPSFKYVANDMSPDHAIYLLYKLRKAAEIIASSEHGLVPFNDKVEIIDKLLKIAWENRSLYPSLGKVVELIGDFSGKSKGKGVEIVELISNKIGPEEDLLNRTFEIIQSRKIPEYLKSHSKWLDEIRNNLTDFEDALDLFKTLSLFSLTSRQIERIVHETEDAFGRPLSLQDVAKNPYLLAEEYISEFDENDLDLEEVQDAPIGIFTIDIGMHPDSSFLGRNPDLQNLTAASKERIRAILIDYLYRRGGEGDCFANLEDVYKFIQEFPLYYKSNLNITKEKLESLPSGFGEHIKERIHQEKNTTGAYFYLKEVKYAEQVIKKTVAALLDETDYSFGLTGIEDFLDREAKILSDSIPRFEKDQFISERRALLSSVFKKHFYVISGKPGSGKTKAIGKIVEELVKNQEQVILLAPTGKATLRLKEEVAKLNLSPETIDRYIHHTDFKKCLINFQNLLLLENEQRRSIQNLIIDECSMIDIQKLAVLFEMFWKDEEAETPSVTRIIMVGDENQLPPIGFGRPFYDIIQMIKENRKFTNENYVQLRTNCRQGYDPEIMRYAEIFETKNRYFEEKIDRLVAGGQISAGLRVEIWKNSDELQKTVTQRLDSLLPGFTTGVSLSPEQRTIGVNTLFGLMEKGFVKDFDPQNMDLENFQILTPYRSEVSGTLGLNRLVKSGYRFNPFGPYLRTYFETFDHADKIIRINNWYAYDKSLKERTLRLSNGSIGLVSDLPTKRIFYFSDLERSLNWIDDEDNFELAYAITVHKAQGSEFNHVFLVLPAKEGLLCKELLYTALTRSKTDLVIFLQQPRIAKNPLEIARGRSAILSRNTSIFNDPEDLKKKFWPSGDVPVKSKIEYIIYKYLQKAKDSGRLDFSYESDLVFASKGLTVHPDFTIKLGNRTIYWEHLGELDVKRYYTDWQIRKKDYEVNHFAEQVVTTDDLEGVRDDLVLQVIEDIIAGKLKSTPGNNFSAHHYQLYL